jgi:DNA-binding MarR family transcriptional regulator
MAKRTSQLEVHLGYWLRFVSNHVSHAFRQRVEREGVTVAEWVVLRELFSPPEAAPSQVAERLGMTRGAISKLAERLLQKGLLSRTTQERDRRQQRLSLTAEGRRKVPILARLADENDREFFGHLPREARRKVVDLLQEIVRRHGWKDAPID